MRLEAGFVRLPMHEFLGAADTADQKEAGPESSDVLTART
jgi:hypothetical protein